MIALIELWVRLQGVDSWKPDPEELRRKYNGVVFVLSRDDIMSETPKELQELSSKAN
jgi:hypothetical protein